MTRLWRAATLVLMTTALVAGPATAGFATAGDTDGRDFALRDQTRDRVSDRSVDVPSDQPADRAVDRPDDRVADRPTDRVVDRPSDRTVDRVTDQVRRPQCDPDPESDRVHDCRPSDHKIRPALARCINHVQNHTDLRIHRSLRWWWHVCHRIA
jgi:hypothetical protein